MKANKYESPMFEVVKFDEPNSIVTTSLETDVKDLFGDGGWTPEIDD